MLNLKMHSTICDLISIVYHGPGFYSGSTKKILQDEIILEKVTEEYIDKEDVYMFCKINGYNVKPYRINCLEDIPSNWEIVQEYENEFDIEDNY